MTLSTRAILAVFALLACAGEVATASRLPSGAEDTTNSLSPKATETNAPVSSTSTETPGLPTGLESASAASVSPKNADVQVPGNNSLALAASASDAGSEPVKGSLSGSITTTPAQAAQYAVVYLENAPVEQVANARLDDHKMTFMPYVSTMTVGGTLTYVNSEPFPDTAFSMSNEGWDFGLVPSKGVRTRQFPKPGNYTVLCRLHPNQVAFLLVLPSSYYAQADKKGAFEITGIPAGTYNVVAWAPRLKSSTQSVQIQGATNVNFSLRR